MDRQIEVLYLPHDADPEVRVVSSLDDMQALVGGMIECISLDPNLDLWCNEEYHYVADEINKRATSLVKTLSPNTLMMGGVIKGNCFLSGGVDHRGETLPVDREILAQLGLLEKAR